MLTKIFIFLMCSSLEPKLYFITFFCYFLNKSKLFQREVMFKHSNLLLFTYKIV
jgi:hypothetical protein